MWSTREYRRFSVSQGGCCIRATPQFHGPSASARSTTKWPPERSCGSADRWHTSSPQSPSLRVCYRRVRSHRAQLNPSAKTEFSLRLNPGRTATVRVIVGRGRRLLYLVGDLINGSVPAFLLPDCHIPGVVTSLSGSQSSLRRTCCRLAPQNYQPRKAASSWGSTLLTAHRSAG